MVNGTYYGTCPYCPKGGSGGQVELHPGKNKQGEYEVEINGRACCTFAENKATLRLHEADTTVNFRGLENPKNDADETLVLERDTEEWQLFGWYVDGHSALRIDDNVATVYRYGHTTLRPDPGNSNVLNTGWDA